MRDRQARGLSWRIKIVGYLPSCTLQGCRRCERKVGATLAAIFQEHGRFCGLSFLSWGARCDLIYSPVCSQRAGGLAVDLSGLSGFDTLTALALCANYTSITACMTHVQAAWRGRRILQGFRIVRGAAITLQSWFRGRRTHRAVLAARTRVPVRAAVHRVAEDSSAQSSLGSPAIEATLLSRSPVQPTAPEPSGE